MSDKLIKIEFVQSETKRYRIGGGTLDGAIVADNCIHLFHKNGSDPIEHVVSIPLHNIREWKISDA